MEQKLQTNLMKGKRGLVTGIANNMSIAWYIAKTLKEQGAELALTYQGEVLHKRIVPLAEELETDFILECDVKDQSAIDRLFSAIEQRWGKLDFIVHAIAFADKSELRGRYLDTSLENFLNSMHISCYSVLTLLKGAERLLNPNASFLTLTYLGAEKVIPNYNVMGVAKAALESSVRYLAADVGAQGIRVNAISAGPIKTLAASAIGELKGMLDMHANTAPLRRNTSQQDVANSALYLLSDLASGVSGEIHYVDCGYNIMGMSLGEPLK